MVARLTALSHLAFCRAWSPICGSGKIDHRPYTPEHDSTRKGTAVTFKEVLAQVLEQLQQDKRLSYRALKRQFALDDDYLDDLKAEFIEVRRVAVEEDGRVLVWTGDAGPAPVAELPPQAPLAYTPPYLAEKILTSRSALEGERKQMTVLFADLKSHHTQGWLRLESGSVSYGKATAYLPLCDLLTAYCHLEDHDDLRTVRAKITGQLLTLDNTLQDTVPAVLALFDALPADSPFLALDPLQRAAPHFRGAEARPAARESGAAAAPGV